MNADKLQEGIYVAKDKITENQYLIALNGKPPMLRIQSALDIAKFAKQEEHDQNKIIKSIMNNPDGYSYELFCGDVLIFSKDEESSV